MEVKINKNNNQKYVNIPKQSDLKEGDYVNITKIKDLNLKDLKNYFEENKEKFKYKIEELSDYYELLEVSQEFQFVENYRKTFGIKEMEGEVSVYQLGDSSVSYDCIGDTVEDSTNFADIEHMLNFEPLLKNIIFEGEEGYEFDKNKYTKEQLKNSAILSYYIKLKRLQRQEEDNFLDNLFIDLGFGEVFTDNDNAFCSWTNEEKNITLVRKTLEERTYKLRFNGKKKIEYDISELI